MIKATINVTYNPLISDNEWIPESLRNLNILGRLILKAEKRNGGFYTISGFWCETNYVAYPLFRRHGHKRYSLTLAEYNALVDAAEINIDAYCELPDGFEEAVAELETVIRSHLKRN